jgi:hypothetical protein
VKITPETVLAILVAWALLSFSLIAAFVTACEVVRRWRL